MKRNKKISGRKNSNKKAFNTAQTAPAATPVANPAVVAATVASTAAVAPVHQVEAPPVPNQTSVQVQSCIETLRSGELDSRIAAVTKLAETNSPEAITALQNALCDPAAEVAQEAALILGKTQKTSSVDALIAVLENANGYYHSAVRAAAAQSLGQLRDPRAIPSLTKTVRDLFAGPSQSAIHALGLLAREQAVPTLLEVVANANHYFLTSVRVAATETLASIPVQAARDCLCNVANNPNEVPEVRKAATLVFA